MKKMSVQYSTNQNASWPDEGQTFGFSISFSLEEMPTGIFLGNS